ncbi:60S ribosomal protein L35 [Pichia californica]|nr:60S ribosomal protein L35 [[Candida] californica]
MTVIVKTTFYYTTNTLSTKAGLKAFELRTKSKDQLEEQLVDLKKELADLRVQKLTKQFVPKIKTVRKDIARVLTIINAQQRASVRAFYAGKKYIPKDLRAKKTRAIRRALTKEQKSLKTERARKTAIAYPVKNFALKA